MQPIIILLTLLTFAFCQDQFYSIERNPSPNCSAGYTGVACDTPICDEPLPIAAHDGTVDEGDLIAWDYAFGCNKEFYFFIDEFITNFTLTAIGGNEFIGAIYKNDVYVIPGATSGGDKLHIARFFNIAAFYGYGQYRLVVQSDGTENCEVYINAPTTLTIDGGFVTYDRDDQVQSVIPEPHQGVAQNPKQNVLSYFAFRVSSALKRPGQATQVTKYLIQGYGKMLPVKNRYNCAANDFAGPFTCDAVGAEFYHLKISGVDTRGNTWQRVYAYTCDANVMPPVTSPAPPPDQCFNNGILINVTQNGTSSFTQECYCGQFYEGRRCETKRCFNGGYPSRMGNCLCQTGYSGVYCENVICDKPVGDFYDLSYRAIVFVVRTGKSMVGHMSQIIASAEKIHAYYERAHSTYVAQWILVTITNGTADMRNFGQYGPFVSEIKGINNDYETICDDALLGGISTYLSTGLPGTFKRSPIFVFSDGLPNDDFDAEVRLMHQLSFFRGQIFFMMTDSASGTCNIDVSGGQYRLLRYIAQFSQGHVSHVPLEELGKATAAFAMTTYSSNVIISNDLQDSCKRAPAYQTFFIDETIESFFISATGRGLSLTITKPDRTIVTPDLFYNYSDNTYIWSMAGKPQVGGYLLGLQSSSSDPCSVRVYGPSITSLWVGVSHGPNDDASITQPTYNEQSHVVAFINKIDFPDSQAIHAEATIWTNAGPADKRTVLYASSGTFRSGCDFHLYFGSWRCIDPYEFFYMNFFVTSKSGSVVQRSFTGFCSATPPTQAPSEDCLNGGYPAGVNGTCICPAHYIGDKCQTIQCLNLGTAIGTTCLCITGYSGQFCEITSCHQRNSDVKFLSLGRSLSFIIQDSISSRTTLKAIDRQTASLVQDLTHQQLNWITNFQLWRFNDTSFTNLISSPDPNIFKNGITNLTIANAASSDPSCRDLKVIPGLIQVLLHEGLTYEGIVYLFINGYMKVNDSAMNDVQAVYELLERTRVKLHVVLTSSSPCGTDLTDSATSVLMNLAQFSGGEFYSVMPSRGGDIVRSIPTQYRNSFVYENFVEDCTTQQSFYFPVDSQMQSFTAYVIGELDDNSPPVYYRPDGTTKFPYTIWNDLGMGTRFDQIIRECDDGWELAGNRCWLNVYDATNWFAATGQCHQNNAVLVTIFNAEEQAYLDSKANGVDYWIGLNDQITYNDWVWDALYGQKLSLDSTGYKNWGLEQPGDDVDKRCVYDKKGVNWTTDDCLVLRPYFCVKHAYDADYEPATSSVQDLIARGIWKLKVKTSEGSCNVQVYGQSGIQYYSQFTSDIHEDSGLPEPLQNAADNRILAHITSQQSIGAGVSGVLEYAHFYKWDMQIIQAQVFQKRDPDGCAFEYISSNFKCPYASFLSLTTGVDRFGYLYQRIQPVACSKGPQLGECVNGVYYGGHCYCDPFYEGDLCTTPICQKGSLDTVKEHCSCYTAYTGAVCNIPVCNRPGSQPAMEPTPTDRTFVLLLDGSHAGNMQTVNSELSKVLATLYQTLVKYTGWFTQYTAIVFRDSTTTTAPQLSDYIESSNFADFTTKLLAEAVKPYTPANFNRSIMAAVVKAMDSKLIQPRSFVWVITDGVPEDFDRVTAAMTAAGRQHSYVNFLIVGDTGAPGGVQYNGTTLGSVFDLITSTGGQYYQVSADSGKLAEFWTGLFSNYYNAYSISNVQRNNCGGGFSEYVQLASNASTLIVDAVGMGQINVFDPDGNKVTMTTVAQSKINIVQTLSGSYKPGLWRVQMPQYQGYCKLAIRGQSTLDVFVAFTQDVGSDGGLHTNDADFFPEANVANAVVVSSNFGKITFAQIFSPDERSLLWSSPMISRQRCIYNYVSSNTFICTVPWFAVAVDGVDDNGFAFRRMTHVHCFGNIRPTFVTPTVETLPPRSTILYPTLPTPTCNYTKPYDVMIMFDGSGVNEFLDFTTIVGSMAIIANTIPIDQDHTRFMLGSYADIVFPATPDFTYIKSADGFLSFLQKVKDYTYIGVITNNIQSIFNLIDESWWRPEAERVIVFFSSVSWKVSDGEVNLDPTPSAKAFVRGGGKLIPIGYGQYADEAELKAMGGTCTKMAANLYQMESVVIPWVTSAICNPDPLCST